jgi:trigger factor
VKVTTQRLPESQVLLEIEVDPDQMQRSLDKAYRRLVQRVEVPGFRKGKTPRDMLERHVGRERLLREANEILIPEVYDQAIEEQDIHAIDQPSIELVDVEPLSFKATVAVRPTVDLGDYQKVRAEKADVEVPQEEIAAAIDDLRRRYAVHEPVERPVETGDIVRADVRMVIDGREVFQEDDAEFRLRPDSTILLPGFAEGIVGAEKGITKEVPITVPEGQNELAGKSGVATITVKEVKAEVLPELNDDFAQEVGEGFANLEALRERVTNDLRERREAQAEHDFQEAAVSALVENAKSIEFPHVLVHREIERLIEDQARSTGRDISGYMELIKRTPEQLHDELLPSATERVKRSLALSQLAENENLDVTAQEIDEEIDKIAGGSGEQGEQMRQIFSSANGRTVVERNLRTRKTIERLTGIASQDGAAPKKKSTKKKTEAEPGGDETKEES